MKSDGPFQREEWEEQTRFFTRLVECADVAILGNSLDGIIHTWNRGAENTFGYASGEIIGKPVAVLIPADRIHEELACVRAIQDGAASRNYETVRLRKGGEQIDVAITASAIRNVEGQLIGVSKVVRDITERLNDERLLRTSEERLRLISLATNDAVWDLDFATGFMQWNPSFCALFGCNPDGPDNCLEVWAERIHPDDRIGVMDRLAEFISSSRTQWSDEYRFRCSTNRYVHVWDRGFILRTTGGKPRRMVGAMVDLTEKREQEQRLRESQTFLQTTLDSLSTRIAILDEDGCILSANTAWVKARRRRSGREAHADVGCNYLQLCEDDTSPAAEAAKSLAEGIRQVLRGERQGYQAEYPSRQGDEDVWDLVRVTPFAGDGRARVVVAHEDITQRRKTEDALRQSEERYQLAMAGSGAGLWDYDVRTGEVYASPRLEELLGRGGPNETRICRAESFIALLHPDDRPKMEKAVAAHLHGRMPYDLQYRVRRLDGELRWFHVRGQAVWDKSGEPTRMAGSVVDISDQIRAEEENRILENQLAQAQKMEAIGTLAGGIAHDFNNILGTIIGYAELALSSVGEEQPRSDLGQILNSAQRARDLVRQILAFSRQQPPRRKVLVLQEEVRDTLRLARASTPTTVEWEVHCAETPILVCADRTQIGQVIINLTNNALHAMKHQKGRIRVQVDTFTPNAAQLATVPLVSPGVSMARVIFQDDGKGIAPENLNRIFDPFFTTKAPGEGTGLGLSVVHGIVKAHGGCITAANQGVHGGAILTVLLPLVTEADVEPATLSPDLQLGSGERVLLVEDDTALGAATARHLERLGYEVSLESSSLKALQRFAEHPENFDVLITDQAMPGIPGLELAAAVSAARPELPILLITGRGEGLEPGLLAEAGIRTVHQKPLELAELAAAVRECLEPLTHA